jgi:aspartate ammonia-lyase
VLRERCVEGVTANPDRMRWFVEHSVGVLTALVPTLGYETASEIAKEALETGQGVYDLVCGRGLMTREELDRYLNPETMVQTPEVTRARAGARDGAAGGGRGARETESPV